MTERDIFLAVLDLPDATARAAYMDAACGGDAARRTRVEALIRSHEAAGSFLAEPAVVAPDLGQAPTRTFDMDSAAESNPGDSEALGFLDPPHRPDSLGRIQHYEVLEVLGRGGFGIVFRAFDEVLQRVVAVKVLAPSMATTSPARKRFLREARSSAQVRHENVVQVYAVEEQPLPYLVMEFIPGETLQQRLDRTGPLEVTEVLRIGRQIADGLAAAHAQGLIHRDIKPSNVMIEGGGRERVKLTDFGLARAADDASISQSGVVAGTPMYMAPEQAKGESLDHRADLFSLGSVLYVMASGRPPFRASTTLAVLKRVAEDDPRAISEIIPEVPEWLCRVIEKLHAKNPEERFQSAKEVADLLGNYLAELESHGTVRASAFAPPTPSRPGANGPSKRPRRRLWKVALAALLLGVIVWRFGPHLVLTAKNRAEIRLAANEPGTELILTRNGQHFRMQFAGGASEVLEVLPGSYEIELRPPVGRRVTRLEYYQQTTLTGHYVPHHSPELKEIYVGRGDRLALTTLTTIATAQLPAPVADGWIALFNGKDLTGWQPHPEQPGNWRVEDGQLVGSGPGAVSHLFSDRGDYEDFHLRAEARINFRGEKGVYFGNSGIYFRASQTLSLMGRYPAGYEAQIFAGDATPLVKGTERNRTGSLYGLKTYERIAPGADAGEWFTLEVIARGSRITIKVNGVTTVDEFEDTSFRRGHFALQQAGPETVVQFRKIEIKELRAAGQSEAAMSALRDLIAAKQRERDVVKMRFDAGTVNPLDMTSAEIELTTARLRLAEAERDEGAIVVRLEDLVTHRQEERRIVAARVEAGYSAPDALDQADGRLADAKARLAKARSESAPAKPGP